MSEALISSILSGDPEAALYDCSTILYSKQYEELETAWIHTIAIAGESLEHISCAPIWRSCIKDLASLLKRENFGLSQTYIMTTKLSLLMRRLTQTGTRGRAQMPRLREKILCEFPDSLKISNNDALGIFRAILPQGNDSHERIFVERILAGLALQHRERRYIDLRDSLEYLSRKKNKVSISTLNGWPAPSRSEADKGDFVWILWGAMISLKADAASDALSLYHRGFRDIHLGLLWGLAYSSAEGPLWSPDEQIIIAKLNETSIMLWRKFKASQPKQEYIATAASGLDIMEKWIPRDIKSSVTNTSNAPNSSCAGLWGVNSAPKDESETDEKPLVSTVVKKLETRHAVSNPSRPRIKKSFRIHHGSPRRI